MAFVAMQLFVREVIYLPPLETLASTQAEAQGRCEVFRSTYVE
jgi:hypothetical protein